MVRNTVLRYLKARLKLVIILSNLCDGLALYIERDKDVLNRKHWIFVLIVFNLILSHGEWFFFLYPMAHRFHKKSQFLKFE